MQIAVIGAGYVGLVVAACLAYNGHQVSCLEKNLDRCNALAQGECPILEEELPQMLTHALNYKRINFTSKAIDALPYAEIIFITVGTPSAEGGQTDLDALLEATSEIGDFAQNCRAVVIKSSVPPGTTKEIYTKLSKIAKCTNVPPVVCNPEFLREGTAVSDFLAPDRIVVGADDRAIGEMLFSLYRPLLRRPAEEIFTSTLNAELIKYASNSYLAVRLSYINELAGLCEKIGGNIYEVANAMGKDHRIGNEYLSPGLGYGGACLPKDTCALAYTAREAQTPLTVLESAIAANSTVVKRLAERVVQNMTPGIILQFGGVHSKLEQKMCVIHRCFLY